MGWMVPPTTCQLGRPFPLRDYSVFFPTTPPFCLLRLPSSPYPSLLSATPLHSCMSLRAPQSLCPLWVTLLTL